MSTLGHKFNQSLGGISCPTVQRKLTPRSGKDSVDRSLNVLNIELDPTNNLKSLGGAKMVED